MHKEFVVSKRNQSIKRKTIINLQQQIISLKEDIKNQHKKISQLVWMRTNIDNPLSNQVIKTINDADKICEKNFSQIAALEKEILKISKELAAKQMFKDHLPRLLRELTLTNNQFLILKNLIKAAPQMQMPIAITKDIINLTYTNLKQEIKLLIDNKIVSKRTKHNDKHTRGYLITSLGIAYYKHKYDDNIK